MVKSLRQICNDIERMKKDNKKMKKDISHVAGLVGCTHDTVCQLREVIDKDSQKQQNIRTESATGRKRSEEKQKVDPLCRVSHLSKSSLQSAYTEEKIKRNNFLDQKFSLI